MHRIALIAALLALFAPLAHTQESADSWDGDAVATLQAEMASGGLTSRLLVERFMRRIEAIDANGPKLKSVIEINPDALSIAAALDAERASKGPRGPLHGIPVLLKDNIDTADRMATTAGSLALLDSKPARDAFLVTKLREAGAVILGKTNLSEWANFRSQKSTSGWSARGGLTRNPYALDRNACGSSSGSGVAIAADLAVVAVGTETDGSIVCPSAINGIVGIKPTVGLISRSGVIPISVSQDTAGPMARSVADAVALLTAMAAPDPGDKATTVTTRPAAVDYSQYLKPDGLRGARIGVARNLADFDDRVNKVLDQAVAAMRAQGAVVVDPVELMSGKQLGEAEFTVLLYEFKQGMKDYLATRPGAPQNLAELIAFNEKESARELEHFGQDILVQAEGKGGLDQREYLNAHAKARMIAGPRGIDAVLRKHKLDAIIAPTVGLAWTTDLVNGDHYTGGAASQSAAIVGYPHITVPAGFVQGLPVGVSFISKAWAEPTLIRLAYSYEQATRARRPPKLESAADRAAAEIAALESKLEAGLAARDVKLLEPLLANRFFWIHGSDGRMDSRKDWLASAARGMALAGQRNARSEHGLILSLYGGQEPDTAVRVARVRVVDAAKNREFWTRQTHTLVREGGQWQLAVGQGVIMYDGPTLDPALHARYAGVYVLDDGRKLVLVWDDGSLLATLPNGAQTQVFLKSPTEEALRNPAAGVLNFKLDDKGTPVSASLMRGTETSWKALRQ